MRVTWSSVADYDVSSEPSEQPRDLGVLLSEWAAAPDKGAYISSLPLCEAAVLCSVAKECLPVASTTRSAHLRSGDAKKV